MNIRQHLLKTIKVYETLLKISSPKKVHDVVATFDLYEEDGLLVGVVGMLVYTSHNHFRLEDMAVTEPYKGKLRREVKNSIMEQVDRFLSKDMADGLYDDLWDRIDIEKECWKRKEGM